MRKNFLRATAVVLTLLVAGSLEAGYAPGCTVALDLGPGPVHEARAVAIQPDGRIVVAGYVDFGADRDFLVARFHPDLTLDTSFNGTGWIALHFNKNDEAFGLAIQTDGKIVAVGFAENNGGWPCTEGYRARCLPRSGPRSPPRARCRSRGWRSGRAVA